MQINVDLQQCVSYELSNWYTVCFSFHYMLLSSLNEHYSFIYKKCSFKLCYKQEMVRLLWRFILLFFFCTCNITLYHNLDLEYACIFKKKICLQETINWKVLHHNSSEFSMLVERKSVPNMLFGISVQTSPLFSNSRNWTSSGIKWNTCIYKKNGSEFLFFLKGRENLFQIYYMI